MNYHNIKKCDMLNGEGIRVVLFVSGCCHFCDECHNPETWDKDSGICFDKAAKQEIFDELSKDYIDGITFSGGEPLFKDNLYDVKNLISEVRNNYPDKTIWLYTGYNWEQIFPTVALDWFRLEDITRKDIVESCDVVVTGKYEKDKADVNYPYAGSTNQKVIDVKKKLRKEGELG